MTPLRQRMREDMLVRNLAENTQRSYVHQMSLFGRHVNKITEHWGSIGSTSMWCSRARKRLPPSPSKTRRQSTASIASSRATSQTYASCRRPQASRAEIGLFDVLQAGDTAFAGEFLTDRSSSGPVDLCRLRAEDITGLGRRRAVVIRSKHRARVVYRAAAWAAPRLRRAVHDRAMLASKQGMPA
jgi:hypothetical protein